MRAQQAARTRERILTAARERFAKTGYEGTTVRSIAAAAGVDPAAVIRYFESKERLFFEVVDRESGWPSLEDCPDDRLGEEIVRTWLWDWEGRDPSPMLALFRVACAGGEMADRVREAYTSSAVTYVRSRIKQDERFEDRVALVDVDVLGLVVNRYVLRLEPLASMPAEDVVRLLGPRLQRHIRGELD